MIGFDYTDRIDPAALVAADCAVVFRYLSNPGWPKNLTGAEARELLVSGRKIVLNYETTATFMLGGYSAGVTCARSARQQANQLGAPPTAKIFYSADFDASSSQVSILMDFLRGAASVDGAALVGLYGGLRAVQAAASAGYATWQTIAWSGGQWDSRAAARQTGEQRIIGGREVDVNQIINLAALGAWGGPTLGDDVALTPEDLKGIAKAVYEYSEETVTINGKPYGASLGQMVHGSWVALNDAAGAVPQMRGQIDNLFHRPVFDPAAFQAAVAPMIQQAIGAGLPADQIAADIAARVPEHLTLTVGSK